MKISYGSGTIIITALLCILKLTEVLYISWLWCFCLIWLPFAILFAVLGLIIVIAIPFLFIALLIEILNNV